MNGVSYITYKVDINAPIQLIKDRQQCKIKDYKIIMQIYDYSTAKFLNGFSDFKHSKYDVQHCLVSHALIVFDETFFKFTAGMDINKKKEIVEDAMKKAKNPLWCLKLLEGNNMNYPFFSGLKADFIFYAVLRRKNK